MSEQNALAQGITIQRDAVSLACHCSNGQITVENPIDLEAGVLKNGSIHPIRGDNHVRPLNRLVHDRLFNQLIEGDLLQQLLIKLCPAKRCQQILRINLQLRFSNFFAIHFSNGRRGNKSPDQPLNACQRENGNNKPDDHFSDHALGIFTNILKHNYRQPALHSIKLPGSPGPLTRTQSEQPNSLQQRCQ